MHVLFVHQNFPAQFRHVAPHLARDCGWKCTFLSQHGEGSLPGVEWIRFKPRSGANKANHYCTRTFENSVGSAHGVYEMLKEKKGLKPDLIVAHSGFGTSLFLPLLYDAPIINFLEYFYHPVGQNLGYRPELPLSELTLMRSFTRNAMILLDLANCTRGWTPTHYQRALFPTELRQKIEVIFDGIPTDRFHRREVPGRRIAGVGEIPADHRIVTYVTRGFELARGFDIFMKAAKRIYEQYPKVTFIVAGRDTLHYGPEREYITAPTFREHVLGQGSYDLSKFRFIENNSPELLSVGDVHIYLTEPFIASWSMIEAMACGAVVVASDQTCVREYITPHVNGLLCPFFDYEAIAAQVVEVLKDPAAYRPLGDAAAETVRRNYSFEVAKPKIRNFFEQVAAMGPRQPSERAELQVREGTWKRVRPVTGEDIPEDAGPAVELPQASGKPIVEMLRELAGTSAGLEQWVSHVPELGRTAPGIISLPGHPHDLSRFLHRVAEWKPKRLLVMGNCSQGLAGMLFLLTRAAAADAQIVLATLGSPLSDVRVRIFQAMARSSQAVRCMSGDAGTEHLYENAQKSVGGKLDVAFLDGLRPYTQVRNDYRHYRNRVRRDGLLAWNGIERIAPADVDQDGGGRLWREVKPLYPQHAEYLAGINHPLGGIALIRTA